MPNEPAQDDDQQTPATQERVTPTGRNNARFGDNQDVVEDQLESTYSTDELPKPPPAPAAPEGPRR